MRPVPPVRDDSGMRHRHDFQPPSYAVLWRQPGGEVCSGELELGEQALRLEGTCRDGTICTRDIVYQTIAGVRVGRAARERIDSRAALVVELPRGQILLLTSPVGLGMIHEMADRLDALVSGGLRV
jgi:hypothetical protein